MEIQGIQDIELKDGRKINVEVFCLRNSHCLLKIGEESFKFNKDCRKIELNDLKIDDLYLEIHSTGRLVIRSEMSQQLYYFEMSKGRSFFDYENCNFKYLSIEEEKIPEEIKITSFKYFEI